MGSWPLLSDVLGNPGRLSQRCCLVITTSKYRIDLSHPQFGAGFNSSVIRTFCRL